MKPTFRLVVVTSILALAIVAWASPESQFERREFTRLLMGVRTRIVLFAANERDADAAARAAFERIAALDAAMSDYRDDSEVVRLGEQAGGEAVPISDDLARVLSLALDVARASDGAFDPTVGPLVAAWREARHTGRLPDACALAEAQSRVAWTSVVLDAKARSVRLARSAMRLDLGGIAKGFAASEAVATLRSLGFARCLVALAGDVAVGDPPPGARGWRVAVRTGIEGGDGGTLLVANGAVSTSGDSEQAVEIGGVLYSHIVDPRTGLGLTQRVAACVVAPDGAIADALATALSVHGPADAAAIVTKFAHVTALVEERTGDRIVRFRTDGFPSLSGDRVR